MWTLFVSVNAAGIQIRKTDKKSTEKLTANKCQWKIAHCPAIADGLDGTGKVAEPLLQGEPPTRHGRDGLPAP